VPPYVVCILLSVHGLSVEKPEKHWVQTPNQSQVVHFSPLATQNSH